jgi:hypothetical protein
VTRPTDLLQKLHIVFVATLSLTGFAAAQTQTPAQTPAATPQSAPPSPATPAASPVYTAMRNVDFHLTDGIVVYISKLYGKLTAKPDQTVVFDDKQSFGIDIDSANIALNPEAITNDLNNYVFAKPDAPLKKLAATIEGNELTVRGLLVSKGGIPFESTGTVAITPEGMIRLHTGKLRALHLPVKGLMDMLGLDTADLVNTKKVTGVSVDKDDLILDPEQILPPPQMHGRLVDIKIENNQVLLTFGPASKDNKHAALANACGGRNYVQFKGGAIRFGKLTMTDSDLVLIDTQPADPFDFAMDHYQDQLVAGYSKITRQGGLCVHAPDFKKLPHPAAPKN